MNKDNDIEEMRDAAVIETHYRNLIDNPSGRWLLRHILEMGQPFSRQRPSGNSWDMYARGRRDMANDILCDIIRFFGCKALDTIMEDNK